MTSLARAAVLGVQELHNPGKNLHNPRKKYGKKPGSIESSAVMQREAKLVVVGHTTKQPDTTQTTHNTQPSNRTHNTHHTQHTTKYPDTQHTPLTTHNHATGHTTNTTHNTQPSNRTHNIQPSNAVREPQQGTQTQGHVRAPRALIHMGLRALRG